MVVFSGWEGQIIFNFILIESLKLFLLLHEIRPNNKKLKYQVYIAIIVIDQIKLKLTILNNERPLCGRCYNITYINKNMNDIYKFIFYK